MTRRTYVAMYGRYVAGHALRSSVVHHHYGFDLSFYIPSQSRSDGFRIRADAPVARDRVHLQAEMAGHPGPTGGEVSGFERKDAIARAERIHQRRFPGAASRCRENRDRALRLKDAPHAVE